MFTLIITKFTRCDLLKHTVLFLCIFLLLGCKGRNEFATDSAADRSQSQEITEDEETLAAYQDEKLLAKDTIVYEQPQVQGGYLSAPDDTHAILWDNKTDRPVRSADSTVVFLSFIIEPDSTASSIRVLKGANPEMDSIAIQAIKDAQWKPGYVKDSPVRSRFAFPVVF